ncbi:phage/plasmid primase, P4 family [Kocuria rosea]|uniref:phage/plasmid primase, P4 family n=1 Tax=Kocuria rosea TaxID=1275 RepID=UPI000D655D97|nr:phage/plasmid primase, P4 family [Kocuria rosea]PWF88685.1 hypothetical protein DEJ37_06245 [Kocuria rosea]STX02470.1 Uncharacterized conserved protein [Kocuria rosea]
MSAQSNAPQAENLEGVNNDHAGREDHHQPTPLHPYGSAPVEKFLDVLTAAGHPFVSRTWADESDGLGTGWQHTPVTGNPATLAQHPHERGHVLFAVMKPGAFAVLDVDPRNGGDLDKLRASLAAAEVPIYAEVHTGGGGRHLYITSPSRPFGDKNGTLHGFPGVDLRVNGAVFLPGTRRVKHDGAPYRLAWENLDEGMGNADDAEQFADWLDAHRPARSQPTPTLPAPVPVPANAGRTEKYLRAALSNAAARLAATTEGGRNHTLNTEVLKLAHYAHHGIYTESEARQVMLDAAAACGLGAAEASATFNSAWGTGTTEPHELPAPRDHQATGDLRDVFTPGTTASATTAASSTTATPRTPDGHPDPQAVHQGETRMAYRLATTYRNRLMHVRGLGWHHWDGTRWTEDQRGHTRRAILDVLAADLADALENRDKDAVKELRRLETDRAQRGVLAQAADLPEFTATTDDLDADPYLLNTTNGTLDLHTREQRPHDPADRCTKIVRGAYRPGSVTGSTWEAFLARSLPNPEVRGFLQRYVGQSLIGRTTEQKLLVLTGEGGNGKTVWSEALTFALGDYALTPQKDMLLAKKNASAFDGSVQLRGRRWVTFSEVEKGRELDVATVKRLTGDESITARELYKANITFRPSHSLAMIANDPPSIPDTGHGIWRRLLMVPWTVVVPEHEQDDTLGEQLEAEADAVLTWALDGLADYQARGRKLDPPPAVTVATAAYREDNDDVAQFLTRCTQPAGGQSVGIKELHDRYKQWTNAMSKERQLGRKEFGKELDKHATSHQLRKNSRGRFQDLMLHSGWDHEIDPD